MDRESGDNGSSVVQETENHGAAKPSDENSEQGSVAPSEDPNHSDVDENIPPNAGEETTDPALDTTGPALDTTGPALDTTGPALDTTGPALDTTGPALDTTGPALDTTGPALDTTGPALDTTGPAVDTTGPAVETTRSALLTTMPALFLLQLPMLIDTPVRILDYPVDEDYNPKRNYIIQDESDLRKLAELVNGTAKKSNGETITKPITFHEATITVKPLESDTVINLTKPWIPIGISSDKSFQGTFDGNHVRIGGLNLSEGIEKKSSRGLFGNIENATIKNLTVGGSFSSDLNGYYQGTGGIAGCATGTCVFENCINQVQITGTAQYVGGIVGNGREGNRYGTVSFTNCRNEGEITGKTGVGGVAGHLDFKSSFLTQCVNQGKVSGISQVGGIVGDVVSGKATMKQCQNKAKIDGSTAVGGILGLGNSGYRGASVSLNCCESSGDVSAKSKQAGGLAGVFPEGTIEDSFVTGGVVCSGSDTGGIVGQGDSGKTVITHCFYYNKEKPLKIAGNSLDKVTECYYLQADKYGSSYGGVPKSVDSFKGKEVAYFLNDQEAHKTTWRQGQNYPELDGNQKVIYRIQIAPYGIDSKSEITLVLDYQGYVSEDDVSDGKNLFLYEGESVSFMVNGSEEDSVTVQAEPSAALTQQDGKYTIKANNSDVSALYGTAADFESPTIAWYSPQKTVFTLTKENELIGLRMLVNGDTPYGAVNFSGKTIQLGADITLKQLWTPISTSANPFSGTFDGNQMHITGLKIGSQETPKAEGNQGFFGEPDQNSKICNLNIDGEVYSNGDYVGGIVGSGKGVIQNCSFNGKIQGGNCTDGIAGCNTNSSSNALTNKASVAGKSNVGGIFGRSDADFGDKSAISQNSGTITGTGDNIGGLVGYALKKVSYGNNSGDVNGDGSCTGGIVGYAKSTINDCHSDAAVTGNNKVGGLVGFGAEKMTSVSAEGTVNGTDTVGGLVGELSSGSLSAFSVTTQTEGTLNTGVIVGSCPNNTVITNWFYYKALQLPGESEDHTAVTASETSEDHTAVTASEASEDHMAVNASETSEDHTAVTASETSEDHTAVNASKTSEDHTTVEEPGTSEESPMWVGEGQADLSQFYFLAPAENDQGGRTAEQFASGEVGWLLDGGEKPDPSPKWTQQKRELYPKTGNTPIYRIRLTAENPSDVANKLKIDGGIAGALSVPTGVQTVYAGEGTSLSFIVQLQSEEDITFTPSINLTKDHTATLKMQVSGNYEGTYRFAVSVHPSYEWLKNPVKTEDGHYRYKLETESDLVGFSNVVNGTDRTNSSQKKPLDFSGDTIELTKDIAMKVGNWIPIGSDDTAFCGTFDGKNHPITGMKISSLANNQGFFGSIRNAAIKNLALSGSVDSSGQYLGGIVGRANGNCTLENLTFGSSGSKSYVKGTGNVVGGVLGGAEPISSSPKPANTQEPSSDQKLTLTHCVNLGDAEGKDSTGGVAGQLSGSSSFSIALEDCENRGKVTGAGRDTGGVAGRCGAFVSLKDCVNDKAGVVNGSGDSTGGVSGYFDVSVSAEGCSNAGAVQGQGKYAGGIAGYASSSVKMKKCKNDRSGKVHGTGAATGGIVGYQASRFSEITDCSNLGEVEGQGKSTGGVAGEASDDEKAVMTGNFNAGTVSGRNNIGGIVGSSAVAGLSRCWNEGNVSTTSGYAGGVVGEVTKKEIQISSCYNTGKVTGTGGAVGGITGSNHAYSDSVGGAGTVPKADSSVTDCYNSGTFTCPDGTEGSITGLNYITNSNCYTEKNIGIDRKFVETVKEEQVKSGELAYLLDRGGRTLRTTYWSQGDQGPVIAANTHSSIYKLSVNVSGGGTIQDSDGTVISKSKVYFVKDGQSFTFTAAPDQGQKLFRVKQNGETVAITGFNIGVHLSSQDVKLSVVFAGAEIPETAILVSFDANGGLFPDGTSVATVIVDPEKSEEANLPDNPTKEKAVFDGWYTAADKGDPAPDLITPKEDVTYFAHWNENIGLFSKGNGSKDNPYEITSAADLELMADVVNAGKEGYGIAYYEVAEGTGTLTADANHTPIGNTVYPFMGVFKGNGVTIEVAGSNGLFGIISNSEFYNFTVDANLSGGLIGAVANYMTGKGDRKTAHFDGITVNGSVKGSSFAGGILGGTDDQRPGKQSQGGKDLVQLIHCRNNAEIHGGGSGVGGLVGFLYADHEIQDCVNSGKVTGTGQKATWWRGSFVGGIAGWINIGTINRCANTGNITGDNGMAGGILGGTEFDSYKLSRSLKNCYNTGNINGKKEVAGICGDYVGGEAKVNEIENCYNYGSVTADNTSSVGDINSESMRDMKNCYALQDIATDGADSSKVTPMSKESFASGEVAYLLDGGESDHNGVWTQDWQNGYPTLGQPSIYQLKVTGNEGLYTAAVTAGDKTIQIKNGGSQEEYAGGGDKPVSIAVHCDSKTVSKDGKNYKVTYEVESITVDQGGEPLDVTSSKRFNMNKNSKVDITVTSKEEEIQQEKPVPPVEEEHGNGHGSGHGDGDGGNGTGSHGTGNGQGSGDQGNGDGLGQGSGTAAGNQSGEGDVVGNSQGGSKDQSAMAPSKASVSSEKDTKTPPASQQNQPVSPEPLISSAQPEPNQQTQDQVNQDQGVQTANSGGLESGPSSGFGDKKTEPDKKDKIKVFEIIKQTVSENPWTSAVIVLLVLAIALAAGLRRYKNSRKNH